MTLNIKVKVIKTLSTNISKTNAWILTKCNGQLTYHPKPAPWRSGRASARRTGGLGFAPRPGHTKDFKNGSCCFHAWRSALNG